MAADRAGFGPYPAMKPRFVVLILITLAAGWLRFTATSFGLPDKFRPDEQYLSGAAFGLDPSWNPHFAIYPSGQLYVDHLAFLLYARLKNSPDFSGARSPPMAVRPHICSVGEYPPLSARLRYQRFISPPFRSGRR